MILKDAPILVLDEATSSLDSITEHLIQPALDRAMAGKTVIVIPHRLSTIAHLDRVLIFSRGRIVDDGSHADLLALGGEYHRLWRRQSGDVWPMGRVSRRRSRCEVATSRAFVSASCPL